MRLMPLQLDAQDLVGMHTGRLLEALEKAGKEKPI